MIIHKQLKTFLEIIHTKNLDFSAIKEYELRHKFKNNEYYVLKKFCLENDLIVIDRHDINLSALGFEFFKILKKCRNI